MTTRISIIFLLLFLSLTSANGQSIEPLELAKRIFGKESFANIGDYLTGEYKGNPSGKDLRKDSITKFTVLGQTDKKAVVGMTILDTSGKGVDTYLHFEKEAIWKMSAFRALAMTGMIQQIVQELEKITPKQIDEIIKYSAKNNVKEGMFKSREEYDFMLGNSKLTLELDENIIKHFLLNQVEFNMLKDSALKELKTKDVNVDKTLPLLENLKKNYRLLLITSVSFGDYEVGSNCLSFSIGGMLDNTVGYLYVKDKKDLPEMNPSGVIMLKEIGNGWYLYKTT